MTLEEELRWQIAQDVQICFGSEVGKRVLEQLRRDFTERTSFHADPLMMAFSEGERHVVLVLDARMRMKVGDVIPLTQPEDSQHE